MSSEDLLVFTFPSQHHWYYKCVIIPGLHLSSVGPSLGPHACETKALLTEPSPWPCVTLLKDYCHIKISWIMIWDKSLCSYLFEVYIYQIIAEIVGNYSNCFRVTGYEFFLSARKQVSDVYSFICMSVRSSQHLSMYVCLDIVSQIHTPPSPLVPRCSGSVVHYPHPSPSTHYRDPTGLRHWMRSTLTWKGKEERPKGSEIGESTWQRPCWSGSLWCIFRWRLTLEVTVGESKQKTIFFFLKLHFCAKSKGGKYTDRHYCVYTNTQQVLWSPQENREGQHHGCGCRVSRPWKYSGVIEWPLLCGLSHMWIFLQMKIYVHSYKL
jgi:hypothetical protein